MLYIIITYNGQDYIRQCIQSILDWDPNSEIWVYDNGSTDSTINLLTEMGVTPKGSGENLGFGAANNLGLKYFLSSKHEACFLLNQDAYLTSATTQAFSLLQQNPQSIIAPLQLSGSGNHIDAFFKESYLQHKHCPNFLEDAYFNRIKETYNITFSPAAAWIIPKSVISQIGGFNPAFFHYGEDRNFIQRCNYHDIQIILTPNAPVLHDRENRSKKSIHKTTHKSKERQLILQLSNPHNNGTGFKSRISAATRFLTRYPLTPSQLNKIYRNRELSKKKGTSFL